MPGDPNYDLFMQEKMRKQYTPAFGMAGATTISQHYGDPEGVTTAQGAVRRFPGAYEAIGERARAEGYGDAARAEAAGAIGAAEATGSAFLGAERLKTLQVMATDPNGTPESRAWAQSQLESEMGGGQQEASGPPVQPVSPSPRPAWSSPAPSPAVVPDAMVDELLGSGVPEQIALARRMVESRRKVEAATEELARKKRGQRIYGYGSLGLGPLLSKFPEWMDSIGAKPYVTMPRDQ